MTTLIPRRALSGVDGLHRLAGEAFARIVVETAFKNARNSHQADTWARLLSPGLIERTRRCLITLRDTHLRAVRQRSTERHVDPDVRRRDQEHTDTINRALGEVRHARAQVNTAASLQSQTDAAITYRSRVRELAVAIARHQAARTGADNALAHLDDLALWSVLDSITIPDGPESQEWSLRWLVDARWR